MKTKSPFTFPANTFSRAGRNLLCCGVLSASAAMFTTSAHAAFHLWTIREIYTDTSGSLQFIELFTTSSSQQFVSGQSISVVSGSTHTFTLPSNLPGDSANHAFLLGTAGLQAAGGPTPDYIMPAGFLFVGGGTINFFGVGSGQTYSALPTDGNNSRVYPNGANLSNNPQNFAGTIGHVVVPEPAMLSLLGAGGAGLWLLLRSGRRSR